MGVRGRFDLHTHSTVSDGTEPPAEVVRQASRTDLGGIALTDHDSTAGWDAARAAARETGTALVPGVELSTRLGWRSVHVLGYLVDPDAPALVAAMHELREERLHRAETMVARIAKDYDLSWDDVLAQTSPGATVGRPHIADALVARGHVSDRSAAFASILHWRGGYYQPHRAPEPIVGVELIRAAGGVPVIAHPGSRAPQSVLSEERIRALVDAGLAGIEVRHRDNSESARVKWADVARRYGLLTTGSSDYHGAGKLNRLGENTTDRADYERIVELGTGAAPYVG